MKYRITITLDEEIIKKVNSIHEDTGAPVSTVINRVLKKEYKIK
jgi:predicted transcriptional regulator